MSHESDDGFVLGSSRRCGEESVAQHIESSTNVFVGWALLPVHDFGFHRDGQKRLSYKSWQSCSSSFQRPQKRAGFTLLEIIIASGLSVTLLLMVWSLFSIYSKLNDRGSRKGTELQLVRSLVAQMRTDIDHLVIPSWSNSPAIQNGIVNLPSAVTPVAAIDSPSPESNSNQQAIDLSSEGVDSNQTVSLPTTAVLVGRRNHVELLVRSSWTQMLIPQDQTEITSSSIPANRNFIGKASGSGTRQSATGSESEGVVTPYWRIRYQWTARHARDLDDSDNAIQSDAKSVRVEINTRTNRQFVSRNTAIGPRGENDNDIERLDSKRGLTRHVLPWMFRQDNETKGQRDEIPEIAELRFRYFDGLGWKSSWDSTKSKTLPLAIEVAFNIDTKTDDGKNESEVNFDNEASDLLEEKYVATVGESPDEKSFDYRFVISVPFTKEQSTTRERATPGKAKSLQRASKLGMNEFVRDDGLALRTEFPTRQNVAESTRP